MRPSRRVTTRGGRATMTRRGRRATERAAPTSDVTVSLWVWFALYWVIYLFIYLFYFFINTSVLQYWVMGFGLLLLCIDCRFGFLCQRRDRGLISNLLCTFFFLFFFLFLGENPWVCYLCILLGLPWAWLCYHFFFFWLESRTDIYIYIYIYIFFNLRVFLIL